MSIVRNVILKGAQDIDYRDGTSLVAFLNAWEDYFSRVSTVGDRKAPNNYSYLKYYISALQGLKIERPSSPVQQRVGFLSNADSHDPGPGYDTTAETEAYNMALSNLNDRMRGTLDLSVDLFQHAETLRMLKAASNLVEYARDFKRQFAHYPLRAFGSKWLELQYGWRPFIGDVFDSMSKLIQDAQSRPRPFSGRGHSGYPVDGPTSQSVESGFPTIARGTWSYRVEIKVYLLPPNSRFQALAGWASLNPVSIAWELLPYSFVVDWMVDVGGYLRNYESALIYRNRFVNGYVSTTSRYDGKLICKGLSPLGNLFDAEGAQAYAKFSRTKLTSYPLPRFPRISPHLGSGRLLNAAALLSQFLRR